MVYFLKIVVLAVIQGAAELLPVSSSAHVILAQKLMGLDPTAPEQTFLLIMLHTGTMFAVIVYFWPRWKPLLLPPKNPHRAGEPPLQPWGGFLAMTLLATFVTGLGVGLILLIEKGTHSEVEALFSRLDLIGAALAGVGVFILIAGFFEGGVRRDAVTLRPAILIGLIQAVCLPFRGFSRSGATISMGLLCGVSRRAAEDFSFAMALLITPAAIGRMAYRLFKTHTLQSGGEIMGLLLPGLVGMVLSFAAGYVALRFLSSVLEHGHWKYFGVYCLAAAAVLFTFAANGW
jgi:undecaprenyl-diphosphatase